MTIRKDLYNNIIIYICKAIANILILSVASRLLPDNSFSSFVYNTSALLISTNLCDMGFKIKIYKDFKYGGKLSLNYYFQGLFSKLVIFFVVMLVFLFAYPSEDNQTHLILSVLSGAIVSFTNYNLLFLNATKSFKFERNSSLIYIVLLGSSFYIYKFNNEINGLYVNILVSSCIFYATSLFFLTKSDWEYKEGKLCLIKDLFPFTIHVYLSVLLGVFDNVFLESYLSDSDFLLFSACLKIVYSCYIVTSIIQSVLSPRISILISGGQHGKIRNYWISCLSIAAIFSFVYIFVNDAVIFILFDGAFYNIDFSTYKYIIAFCIFLKIATVVPGLVCSMSGKQWHRVLVLAMVAFLGYVAYYFVSVNSNILYILIVYLLMNLSIFICYTFLSGINKNAKI